MSGHTSPCGVRSPTRMGNEIQLSEATAGDVPHGEVHGRDLSSLHAEYVDKARSREPKGATHEAQFYFLLPPFAASRNR